MYPKYYHDVQQQSPEWFELRSKRITASHAQAIGNNGKGLETYIIEKMASCYSSAEKETYLSKDMQRGNELELEAAVIYTLETDLKTENIGFISYSDHVGVSPDLLVEDNGLAEIKCPNDKNYFKFLLDGKIDSKYIWQMNMQMLCSNRSWCDFVSYNPNFKRCLSIHRVYADSETTEALFVGFKIAEKLMLKYIEKYETIK